MTLPRISLKFIGTLNFREGRRRKILLPDERVREKIQNKRVKREPRCRPKADPVRWVFRGDVTNPDFRGRTELSRLNIEPEFHKKFKFDN